VKHHENARMLHTDNIQIVYVAIVGTVMLMAVLEWILWLAAFLYCLVKVFIKAENTSIRVLSVVVGILFTAFRSVFLPLTMYHMYRRCLTITTG